MVINPYSFTINYQLLIINYPLKKNAPVVKSGRFEVGAIASLSTIKSEHLLALSLRSAS